MEELLSRLDAVLGETGVYTVNGNGVKGEWTIEVVKDAVYPDEQGNVWPWRIDGQYFNRDNHACAYLMKRVKEKESGIRIIPHKKKDFPDLCRDRDYCRYDQRKIFSMLCYGCPKAEQIQAEAEGLSLVYQPEPEEVDDSDLLPD